MRVCGVVGLIVLLAFGCHSQPSVAPHLTTGTRASAPTTEPSKELIRAALLSVYFHAQDVRAESLPVEIQPIGLEYAAEVLRAAADPLAESRRRRAIVRLAVAGMDDVERCRAVETLYGQPIGSLVDILLSLPGSAGRPAREPLTTPTSVGSMCPVGLGPLVPSNAAMVAVAAKLAASLGPAIKDCDYVYHPATANFDASSSTTTVVADTAVPRSFAAVRKVMDPQQWDQCNVFFEETYIAEKSSDGFDMDSDYNVPPDLNPPLIGTPYEAVLFEHFVVAIDPYSAKNVVTAWYKNLLNVSSQELPVDGTNPTGGHVYKYDLLQSLASYIYSSTIRGGLDIDDGEIVMHPDADANWTKLHATKALRFSGRWNDEALNQSAGWYLEAMGTSCRRWPAAGVDRRLLAESRTHTARQSRAHRRRRVTARRLRLASGAAATSAARACQHADRPPARPSRRGSVNCGATPSATASRASSAPPRRRASSTSSSPAGAGRCCCRARPI
jgi:hypothetical protein